MRWRLIDNNADTAFRNMAVDEALLQSTQPVLRFYSWKPKAVSIGYFQSLDAEVDTKACKTMGIDIVRRITGGGAVFHDQELTYSVICPEELFSFDILESYQQICGFIVKGLKKYGLAAEFVPINDITIKGKKISGNAQSRKQGKIIQHGTILLDVDVDEMFKVLKVADEKMKDKMINNVKDRVTSLSYFGHVNNKKLKQNIISAFEDFGISFKEDKLRTKEETSARVLETKFNSFEWNNKR